MASTLQSTTTTTAAATTKTNNNVKSFNDLKPALRATKTATTTTSSSSLSPLAVKSLESLASEDDYTSQEKDNKSVTTLLTSTSTNIPLSKENKLNEDLINSISSSRINDNKDNILKQNVNNDNSSSYNSDLTPTSPTSPPGNTLNSEFPNSTDNITTSTSTYITTGASNSISNTNGLGLGLSMMQSSPPPHSYRHSRAYRHFKNPPQPHMCIRTTTESGEELFINVLSWTRIVIPQEPSDPIPLYGGMRVPPGSPRSPPIVFAVMANPEVLKDSGRHSKDAEERRAMVELMCDFVEAMNPGVKLVRNAVILKDRDISGELKDVWNAVQAQRDREREEQIVQQRQQQHYHNITTQQMFPKTANEISSPTQTLPISPVSPTNTTGNSTQRVPLSPQKSLEMNSTLEAIERTESIVNVITNNPIMTTTSNTTLVSQQLDNRSMISFTNDEKQPNIQVINQTNDNNLYNNDINICAENQLQSSDKFSNNQNLIISDIGSDQIDAKGNDNGKNSSIKIESNTNPTIKNGYNIKISQQNGEIGNNSGVGYSGNGNGNGNLDNAMKDNHLTANTINAKNMANNKNTNANDKTLTNSVSNTLSSSLQMNSSNINLMANSSNVITNNTTNSNTTTTTTTTTIISTPAPKKEKLGGFLPNGCIFPRFKNSKHKDKEKDKDKDKEKEGKTKDKEKTLLNALKKSKEKKVAPIEQHHQDTIQQQQDVAKTQYEKNCLNLENEVQKLDLNKLDLSSNNDMFIKLKVAPTTTTAAK